MATIPPPILPPTSHRRTGSVPLPVRGMSAAGLVPMEVSQQQVEDIRRAYLQEAERVVQSVDDSRLVQVVDPVSSMIADQQKESILNTAVRYEESLQLAITSQQVEHTRILASLTERNKRSLDELELQWGSKMDNMRDEHSRQIHMLQTSNDTNLKQIAGTHSIDLKQYQEREMRERNEQIKAGEIKLHAAESANLKLQLQVADLSSKLETSQLQLSAIQDQGKLTQDRMEQNLKILMQSIEEERRGRQDAENRQQTSLKETNERVAELMEKQKIDLAEVADTERVKHQKELSDMQREVMSSISLQASQNVQQVTDAYSERVRQLEQQLAAREADATSKFKTSEMENRRLTQEKELQSLEFDQQQRTLQEKLEKSLRDTERSYNDQLTRFATESKVALDAADRQAALTLEGERLSLMKQRTELNNLLEDERSRWKIEKQSIENLRLGDIQAIEQKHEALRLEADNARRNMENSFQDQLKLAEEENNRMREEVELRLQNAAERHNQQLAQIEEGRRSSEMEAERKVRDAFDQCNLKMKEIESAYNSAGLDLNQQMERSKLEGENHRLESDQAKAKSRTAEMEMTSLKIQLDKAEMALSDARNQLKRLTLEKEAYVRDKDHELKQVAEAVSQQLKAADADKATLKSQLEDLNDINQKIAFSERKKLDDELGARLGNADAKVFSLEQQLQESEKYRISMQQFELDSKQLIDNLREKLSIAETANGRLRLLQEDEKQVLMGDAAHQMMQQKSEYLSAQQMLEANIERMDTDAVKRLFETEQRNTEEKKEMERVAQLQMLKVGEKFQQQIQGLQQIATALQQRLVEKDGQTKRVSDELIRAQRAISEITMIYQQREKEYIEALHSAQVTQIGLNDGIRQAHLESQIQRSQDEQKLQVLQGQVQQAMTAMHKAVDDTTLNNSFEIQKISNLIQNKGSVAQPQLGGQQLQQQIQQLQLQQQAAAVPAVTHSAAALQPAQAALFNLGAVQPSVLQELQQGLPAQHSTQTVAAALQQAPQVLSKTVAGGSTNFSDLMAQDSLQNGVSPNQVAIQHAFSQKLAKKQAAMLKQALLFPNNNFTPNSKTSDLTATVASMLTDSQKLLTQQQIDAL